MTLLVPLEDFLKDLGSLDETDRARAGELLSDASELAREIGSVRLAVKRAAKRAFFDDPEGFSTESLGDWSGTKPMTSLDESGVFFTAAEEARIRKAAGFRSGVTSLRTPSAYGPGVLRDTLYAPVEGGSPIPLLAEEDVLP